MAATAGPAQAPYSVYFFGDQTNPYESDLAQLLHVKDCEVLSSFFEKAHYALRLEISRLSQSRQSLFPRFTCINDLLSRKAKNGANPALELSLLCLTQLARFIRHHGNGSRPYPKATDTTVLGLCTGSLAAAAISTSTNVFELVPVAVETVLIAFRIGLRSVEVRDDLEKTVQGSSPVWSIIAGMDEARAIQELDAFSAAKGYAVSSRPYLSAINPNSVTISGPSKTLDALLQTTSFQTSKVLGLPVYAPYHAGHLYSVADIDAIVQASNSSILSSHANPISCVSCSSGKAVEAANFETLIRSVLQHILIDQLRWDNVLAECAINPRDSSQCIVIPIVSGPNFPQSLAALVKKTLNLESSVDESLIQAMRRTDDEQQASKASQSKIAIIGYSGRFPDAESTQEFWDLLKAGRDVHRKIPADRFDADAHFDPTGKKKNTSKVQHGCFIPQPGLFDARFFNMSPREASDVDPGQRLAIVTAYEALEMAGFVPDRTPSSQRDRVGTFYGMTSDDWREVNSGQNVGTYFIPGGNRAFTPGRINYYFKFSGPSYSVDTACSSSFAAIHTACNSLWRGDCDTAVAGGTNVMTNPDNFAGLDRGHFLSTTGNCNTFDDGANGYCRADAVGTVILKRLEDAQADRDPIHGVILGALTNHSAEADSITRPHSGAQAFIFDKMLRRANRTPLDISYIEMHGTGTQAGDAVEMNSVLQTFAQKPRGPQHPLYLGSAKANIGHAESASGVASLIKVLLMMKNSEIPRHVGIKTKINHNFPADLKARNVNIAMEDTPWKRPAGGKRAAFMNNFSAAGGNTALLMEDAPEPIVDNRPDNRSVFPVAISAKGVTSLQKNIAALIATIDDTPDLSLPALSYTTTARRAHLSFRVMVAGSNLQSIKKALEDQLPCDGLKPVSAKAPSMVFVFTGQGSIYSGMAGALYEKVSSFRSHIQRLDAIAQSQGFPSFLPLIDGSAGDVNELSPVVTQVGAACAQMALAHLWTSYGVSPSAVVGHSLGEYAALHVAGVLSASDAIYLTGTRAQLFSDKCTAGTHSMLAVKAPVAAIRPHLAGTACEVACINGPTDVVISGPAGEVAVLADSLGQQTMKCVKLGVPFAFHSAQVEPILDDFERAARGATFDAPALPFISPLLAKVVTDAETLKPAYLRHACRQTVDFESAISAAKAAGIITDKTLFVEIGAHPVCSGMLKSILGAQTATAATLRRNQDTWQVIVEALATLHRAGADVNWNEYHRDFPGSHRVVRLPFYHFDEKNHWIQYSNNFCLTKGDAVQPVAQPEAKPKASPLSTTSVQRVVEQNIGDDKSTVLTESDLADPTLARVIQGHKVNGTALCPSSLWADVALTVADYLAKASKQHTENTAMAVSNMVVENPLIGSDKGPQLFRASATADWKAREARVHIYSVNQNGQKTVSHANCTVQFADKNAWLQDWKRNAYLIQSRIKSLKADGNSDKIKRGMVYKLFGALMNYSSTYQAMQEVTFDSAQLEVTAKVQFQTTAEDGSFFFNPVWIDSLGQVTGFTMNANDGVDSKSTVFVNHGWESMLCASVPSRDKTYYNYVRMQNIGGTMHAGDVYIFDEDDNVVALYRGVKFQGIPRRALDIMLPGGSASASGSGSGPKPKTVNATPAPAALKQPTVQLQKAKAQKALEVRLTVPAVVPAASSNASKALSIIAEEIGLAVSELTPTSTFADLGVDSLLTLTITSRLREELEMEVPPSLFVDCPTVRDLNVFLGAGESVTTVTTQVSTAQLTPDTASVASDDTDVSDITPISDDEINIMARIRCVLAEEIGVSPSDLKNNTDFAELGMDSLMALTCLARLREELTIELSGSLFADNDSLDQVEASLGLKKQKPVITVEEFPAKHPVKVVLERTSEKLQATSTTTVRVEEIALSGTTTMLPSPVLKPTVFTKPVLVPKCSSLLLQGNPKTATKTLFLFPDGSGSATSYAPLPTISADTVVYGLNCPYMMKPEQMKGSLEDVTPSYLNEIRRRQPQGPYYFGGWSAGGICAFDAVQALQREGIEVARLILIDSPVPIGLEKLPPRLYDFFKSIKMFGSDDRGPPAWLIPHFLAFVDSLDKYRAVPFAKGTGPQTHLIWAKDGVCKYPTDPRPEPRADDPREMKWLLNNRTDLSANGWDGLVGGADVNVEVMENANHFTLMQGDKAAELARFLARAML